MKNILKFIFTILILAPLLFPNNSFAQPAQNQQQPPRAIPVNEQTLQPIQRTFNSQGFNPSGAYASSFATCIASSALVNGVKTAITSVLGSVTDFFRVPTGNAVQESKDTGTLITGGIPWDQIGWCLVNSMIEAIGAATVNWINSGFQGNPVFVTDPAAFFGQLADYQAGMFLNELSGGFLCQPIQNIVRVNLAQNYNSGLTPFGQRAQCTFTGVSGNLEQFMSGQSFGWDDWISYTQNPYNNPLGATIYGGIELDRRIAQSLGIESKLLDWGAGFFSSRNPETGEVTSPGTVIEKQVNERLFSGQRRLEIADEFDEVINALVNQLIKMAVDEMTQKGGSSSGRNTFNQLQQQSNQAQSGGGGSSAPNEGVMNTNFGGGGNVVSTTSQSGGVVAQKINTCKVNGSLNPTNLWQGDVNSIDWNNPDAPISRHFVVRDAIRTEDISLIRDYHKRNILTFARELDKVFDVYPFRVRNWFLPGTSYDPAQTEPQTRGRSYGLTANIQLTTLDRNQTPLHFMQFLRKNWSGGVEWQASISLDPQGVPEIGRDPSYTRTFEPFDTVYFASAFPYVRLYLYGNGGLTNQRPCYDQEIQNIEAN